jgi:hypothetical protein
MEVSHDPPNSSALARKVQERGVVLGQQLARGEAVGLARLSPVDIDEADIVFVVLDW